MRNSYAKSEFLTISIGFLVSDLRSFSASLKISWSSLSEAQYTKVESPSSVLKLLKFSARSFKVISSKDLPISLLRTFSKLASNLSERQSAYNFVTLPPATMKNDGVFLRDIFSVLV